jgi:hypothetical protein
MPGTGGWPKFRRLHDTSGRPRWVSNPLRWVAELLQHGLGRLNTPLRRAMAAGVMLLMVVAFGAVASSGFGTAVANDTTTRGEAVPVDQVQPIAAAALACPMLSPAKLAGQLMATSGFNVNARTGDGGTGVAGLTDVSWNKWKPGPGAKRTDAAANIFALAHQMCDLSGQVRQAGIGGDQWRLALGAYHSGVAAVRDAKGVPGGASEYVGRVAGYAAWYAGQPEFAVTNPSPSSGPVGGTAPVAGTPAKPVPDEYVAAVLDAGKTCPTVSPFQIAAQLMAASGFNPNLLGANGAQGIAQFLPQIWALYAPNAATTSPWDPSHAVPALGRTMCSLVSELGGLGKDPYQVALAAFTWGPEAVKQAGGVPDTPSLRDYVSLVESYVKTYSLDPRLGGGPQKTPDRSVAHPTSNAGSPTPPAGGGEQVAPPVGAGTAAGGGRAPAPNPGPQPVGAAALIIGYASNRCIDVTDGAYNSNPQLQIWDCNGGPNQQWTFYSDGTVRAFDRCMTVAGGSTANGVDIVLNTCSGSAAQRFTLNAAHDLVNQLADKCVDARDQQTANGVRLQLWACGGTSNQKWHR